MNVKEKNILIKKLLDTEEDVLLNQVKIILESDFDFWNQLPEEIKRSVKKAKQELNDGKSIPHHLIMSEVKKKYLKK